MQHEGFPIFIRYFLQHIRLALTGMLNIIGQLFRIYAINPKKIPNQTG